ncbi:20620_t:CDS:2 [Rhizophagus irregularis]|nr:20620_t:CDS:2 [Rhizophagus irregularis]
MAYCHCAIQEYKETIYYQETFVLDQALSPIGGSVFIEAGAVEIFAFSLENHHGVNSEKNWVYGLIITDVSFLTISCVKQLILVATRLEKHFLDASKHDISALLSTSSADVTTGTNCSDGENSTMTSTQTDNFAEVSESMKEQEFILREIPLKLFDLKNYL